MYEKVWYHIIVYDIKYCIILYEEDSLAFYCMRHDVCKYPVCILRESSYRRIFLIRPM